VPDCGPWSDRTGAGHAGGRGIALVAVTRGRGCNWRSLRPEQGPAFGLVAREAGPFCFTCIKEGPLARPSIVQSEVR